MDNMISPIICKVCNYFYDGSIYSFCPYCVTRKWEFSKGIIRRKHDPFALPLALSKYRTVVTTDFVQDKNAYLSEIAFTGSIYFNNDFRNFTYYLNKPHGVIGGSVVPAGLDLPTHPVGGAIIADVFNTPHAFAEDPTRINFYITNNQLVKPTKCSTTGCLNLSIPGKHYCIVHGTGREWSFIS